jgi:hypothetical protein
MRRAAVAVAVAVVALLAAGVAPARAADLRALGGADLLLATGPSGGVEDAELGLTLRADLRDVAGRFDFRLDYAAREAFVGNSTYNNLYELAAVARRLGGRLDVTLGRFRTPGGFWLIADGAMLTVRYAPWLSQSVYGGLRAFTTGRRATWMTDSSPVALPLAGTSIAASHRLVSGSLTFSWSQDGIDLHQGYIPTSSRNVLERHLEDEYFLDGQLAIYPHPKLFASAGASLGTRYDVQFNSGDPYGATTLAIATLGSIDVYAVAEYRPIKRLRLTYSFNYERVRLFQSHLLTLTPAGTPVAAADGSFEDHDLRALYLAWRALRLEARYRLRLRANTDVEHHVTLGARGDELWRHFGAFASIGIDADSGVASPSTDPALRKVHDRAIYSAGLSYVRTFLDARLGITYTDGIGSGLLFSQNAMSGTGAAPTELFPYVLETNRIVFVRVFATFWKMFAGLDVEENLDAAQARMLAQIGASL